MIKIVKEIAEDICSYSVVRVGKSPLACELEYFIAEKLNPIRHLLVNSKLQSNPTIAYELVDKAIEMLAEVDDDDSIQIPSD